MYGFMVTCSKPIFYLIFLFSFCSFVFFFWLQDRRDAAWTGRPTCNTSASWRGAGRTRLDYLGF